MQSIISPQATSRDLAIARIKAALRQRTPTRFSVTGGRGTSWGWITITSIPSRQIQGCMSDADRHELAALLGLPTVHSQGESIPSSTQHYQEYIDRAEGRTPSVIGRQYWD